MNFQFYVTDDRVSARPVMFVNTRDAASARVLAQRVLENRHYRAVEVCDGEETLFTLTLVDDPQASAACSGG